MAQALKSDTVLSRDPVHSPMTSLGSHTSFRDAKPERKIFRSVVFRERSVNFGVIAYNEIR
jgi:hypothetical protein